MSQITVGYTDKVRKTQTRGPPGGMSDIFSVYSQETVEDKDNSKLPKASEINNQNNGHIETKICEGTKTLSLEENSNHVKTTVESTKIEEVKQTTQVNSSIEVTNEEIRNGNMKENGNVEQSTKSTQKVLNNITQSDEKDCPTPSRRNRVPPGGYSSGFW